MKLNNAQIIDLVNLSEEIQKENPQLRLGQCYFNVLYSLYPEISDEIRGTKYDPFYVDEKIGEFLKFISK